MARQSEAAPSSVASDYALGRIVRDLRAAKGYTLTELSRFTGLSPSFISQLERGLTRASLHSLAMLADALGSSAAAILTGAAQSEPETVSFVRASDGPTLSNIEGRGQALVLGKRSLSPLLLVGGPREFDDTHVVHSGDEFIHVLAGRVQFELVGEGVFDLGRGDSLYYGAGIKHRWRQLGSRECRFISVLQNR
jgi:transcriptional regulator with XRE-family HTH domain